MIKPIDLLSIYKKYKIAQWGCYQEKKDEDKLWIIKCLKGFFFFFKESIHGACSFIRIIAS